MEYFNQIQFSNFRIHSALLVIKLPLNSILISENTLKRGNITPITQESWVVLHYYTATKRTSDQFREVVDPRYLDMLHQTVINLCV